MTAKVPALTRASAKKLSIFPNRYATASTSIFLEEASRKSRCAGRAGLLSLPSAPQSSIVLFFPTIQAEKAVLITSANRRHS